MTYKPEDFPEEQVEYFYKYLPFDEGSLKTITEGTILFKSPKSFNDPFDCIPHLKPASPEDISKGIIKKMGQQQKLSPGKRVEQRTQLIRKLQNNATPDRVLTKLIDKLGILCLSKRARNILMWSHYAKDHTGFVLEFRIPVRSKREEILARFVTEKLFFPLIESCV